MTQNGERVGEEGNFTGEEEVVTIAPLPPLDLNSHALSVFLNIVHWPQMFYGNSRSVKPGEVAQGQFLLQLNSYGEVSEAPRPTPRKLPSSWYKHTLGMFAFQCLMGKSELEPGCTLLRVSSVQDKEPLADGFLIKTTVPPWIVLPESSV